MKNEVFAAREAEIARLHQRIVEMDARAQAAMARETALQQQLAALYSSTSWRIARPPPICQVPNDPFPDLS